MLLLIVSIVVVMLFLLWRHRKRKYAKVLHDYNDISRDPLKPLQLPRERDSPLPLRIELSTSIRSYNPEAYRFDGLARPEFRIEYADADGVITERDIYVHWWDTKGNVSYLDCWCFLRNERRTFRSDRILSTKNLQTGRPIKDIVAYRTR